MIEVAEMWKPVPGFEGDYEVSDQGNVRSVDREIVTRAGVRKLAKGKIIAPNTRGHQRAYLYVCLWKNRRRTTQYVHRLVLLAFVGPPGEGEEASHEPNPDTFDCRLCNLKWRTRQGNLFERDMRARGASAIDILLQLNAMERQPGYDDEEPVEDFNPAFIDADSCPF